MNIESFFSTTFGIICGIVGLGVLSILALILLGGCSAAIGEGVRMMIDEVKHFLDGRSQSRMRKYLHEGDKIFYGNGENDYIKLIFISKYSICHILYNGEVYCDESKNLFHYNRVVKKYELCSEACDMFCSGTYKGRKKRYDWYEIIEHVKSTLKCGDRIQEDDDVPGQRKKGKPVRYIKIVRFEGDILVFEWSGDTNLYRHPISSVIDVYPSSFYFCGHPRNWLKVKKEK